MGAMHTSSKYGVSLRDQTTHNQRVSGTISQVTNNRTRPNAPPRSFHGLFNFGRFAIG